MWNGGTTDKQTPQSVTERKTESFQGIAKTLQLMSRKIGETLTIKPWQIEETFIKRKP